MNSLEALRRMAVFVEVVDAGSFTKAASRLGMTKSGVSRHVSLLEESVGAPLLARTTRRLSLTDAGEAFYTRCARMVAEADAALADVRGRTERPVGRLVIAGPQHLGQTVLAFAVQRFAQRHPQVEVDLICEDGFNDLVAEQIDVAIRVGRMGDSTLIAKKLASVNSYLVAAPAYLRARGEPSAPAALTEHDFLVYTQTAMPHRLTMYDSDGGRVQVRMDGRIRTNSGAAVHRLALAGAGIALLPDFYLADDLTAGRLVQVLPAYRCDQLTVHAVYVPGRDLLPKVRLFIDQLVDAFTVECNAPVRAPAGP